MVLGWKKWAASTFCVCAHAILARTYKTTRERMKTAMAIFLLSFHSSCFDMINRSSTGMKARGENGSAHSLAVQFLQREKRKIEWVFTGIRAQEAIEQTCVWRETRWEEEEEELLSLEEKWIELS